MIHIRMEGILMENKTKKYKIKLIAFVVAFLLLLVSVFGFNAYLKKKIKNPEIAMGYMYINQDEINDSLLAMNQKLQKNSILVLGSSELFSHDKIAYPTHLFKSGKSDFNMILSGKGHMQSLIQTIKLGAYSDLIKNNKVVLIVSPQWFQSSSDDKASFESVFSQPLFKAFLENKNISPELKDEIIKQSLNKTKDGSGCRKYIENEYKSLMNKSLFDKVNGFFESYLLNLRSEVDFYKANKIKKSPNGEKVKVENIDFDELLNVAQTSGAKESNNNEFGIENKYFDKYIKKDFKAYKNADNNKKLDNIDEFEELELFLKLCKDLKIDAMVVNVPVNGAWYDYAGFPKEEREKCYASINNLVKKYDQKVADFSDKEYEKYFLKDKMHLGWKGWVYLDEAVYKFYKEN